MRFPPLLPHPRRVPLQDQLARHPEWLSPWSGRFFRFQTLSYPSARDILSGTGAKLRGGRWNPPGLAALYGSPTDTVALEEAKANDRYYGLATTTPRLVVAIEATVARLLDLTAPAVVAGLGLPWPELADEDWRRRLEAGEESLSQALGCAAACSGAAGLIAPSAAVPGALTIVVFPPLGRRGRLEVLEAGVLRRITSAHSA